MPFVELEVESCEGETAPAKCEIHGSPQVSWANARYPEKIQAILQMTEPKDVTALKRFLLGMVTYLAKFMPHLSEMTEPLRRLEDKNVEFQWLDQHSAKHTARNRPTRSFSHTSYPCALGGKLVLICLFLDSRHASLIMVDYWSNFFEVVEIHR